MYASNSEQQRHAQVQSLAGKLYAERYLYLLSIAAKNAASHADAEEAVNEAFASFIRAFDPDGGAPPLAWLILTLKRECWAKSRRQHLDRNSGQKAATDPEGRTFSVESIASGAADPAQLVERVQEARTQLARLKPAERRAIGLIGAGYSYREVGEITGWSFTKINRCASEGRAALRASAEGV